MYRWEWVLYSAKKNELEMCLTMATTGELRAIIEELELVDIGDAASYLGEAATGVNASAVSAQSASALVADTDVLATSDFQRV